jgi:hypothetical protein
MTREINMTFLQIAREEFPASLLVIDPIFVFILAKGVYSALDLYVFKHH